MIFENTHQCVVSGAELRLSSTWPCSRLSLSLSLSLPLCGWNLLYIFNGSKSNFLSWIFSLKLLYNPWNRLCLYLFTTQCSIKCYLWITRREQKEVCLPGVPGLTRPCSVAAGQSLDREAFQCSWTPPLLSSQPSPSLVYFHWWAKGKKGFKPAQSSHWFSDELLWLQ